MQELKFNKEKWKKVSLGEIVFEPKETAKSIVNEGFEHIVGLEHIDSDDIHLRKSFSADTDTTFTKVFRQGDVLFGRRRAYLKKAAQATFDGVCSGDITVLRAKANVDSRLLPFIIHNDKFFDYAIKHSAGGLSPRVKFKDLANYEFLLPPKEQQAELADLLWAMDEVIEKDLMVVEKLASSIKSITLFALDNFEKKAMGKIAKEIIGGFAFKSETFKNKNSGYIPVIKITNVKQNGIDILEKANYVDKKDLNENVIKKYSVNEGDVVLALTGATLGKSTLIKEKEKNFLINQRVAKIQFSEKTNFFYKIILDSDYFKIELKKYISEGAQGNISINDLSKILLPMIKTDFSLLNKIRDLNNSKFNLDSKIQYSNALKKSLINQVF